MLTESDINQINLCEFARNGDLDKFKYLSSFLDENGKNAEYNLDITGDYIGFSCDNYEIICACDNGHIEFVDYLMKNWLHLINIAADNSNVFSWACMNGYIYLVVYLMENWSHLIDITTYDNFAICFACVCNYIDIVAYLISVRVKKILNCGLDVYFINLIIDLLVKNDATYEYKVLTDELNKRKIKFDCCEKLEEQIEKKHQLCAEIECHPKLIGGQMGKNCKEGFEEVKKLTL